MKELKGDWRDLFNGFRMALDARKLLLAFVGLAISLLGAVFLVLLLALPFNPELRATFDQAVTQGDVGGLINGFREHVDHAGREAGKEMQAICQAEWAALCDGAAIPAFRETLRNQTYYLREVGAYLLAICLWSWFVWAYLGGAIGRLAAVEFAKDERLELKTAIDYSRAKYRSYFWPPVTVTLTILFFGLCNVAGGLFGRNFLVWIAAFVALMVILYLMILVKDKSGSWAAALGTGIILLAAAAWGWFTLFPAGASAQIPYVGPILVALFFPLALLSGFLIILLFLGLLFGWPFMLAAVSAEGTDSFDAISRAFSYVYSRPWRYIFYGLVAKLYGLVCVAFVLAFVALLAGAAFLTGWIGMGRAFDPILQFAVGTTAGDTTTLHMICGFIIRLFLCALAGLICSYLVSYVISQTTVIYFLLRKAVDGTEVTEVYEEPIEEEPLPAAEGSAAGAGPAEADTSSPAEDTDKSTGA